MAKKKMKLTWNANPRARKTAFKRRMEGLKKKAEELYILCGLDACLTFFNPDDNKLVAWPSQDVAESLIDRFYSLPSFERNTKADTQESYLETSIQKIQKKLVDSRKQVADLKMNNLISQLENGRSLDDLSKTELENLRAYTNEKIMGLNIQLGYPKYAFTSFNKPFLKNETPRVLDVTSEGQGYCSSLMGRESIYLMDKWFFDDPKVQENGDGTHVSKIAHRFDLNLEPSDDEEDMQTYKGESSKSDGASEV